MAAARPARSCSSCERLLAEDLRHRRERALYVLARDVEVGHRAHMTWIDRAEVDAPLQPSHQLESIRHLEDHDVRLHEFRLDPYAGQRCHSLREQPRML